MGMPSQKCAKNIIYLWFVLRRNAILYEMDSGNVCNFTTKRLRLLGEP
jgi:hypothetical protein